MLLRVKWVSAIRLSSSQAAPQVTPELARKAGADEGFGRGSRGVHNATFLVKRRWEMEKAAAEKADSENK